MHTASFWSVTFSSVNQNKKSLRPQSGVWLYVTLYACKGMWMHSPVLVNQLLCVVSGGDAGLEWLKAEVLLYHHVNVSLGAKFQKSLDGAYMELL